MKKKQQRKPTPPAALPPIPADTPEGIRIAAIAETIRALNTPTEDSPYGLELQSEEFMILGERLRVPAAFIAAVYYEAFNDTPEQVEHIEAYVAWRRRLAGRTAVA